jgi:hypothetical protein
MPLGMGSILGILRRHDLMLTLHITESRVAFRPRLCPVQPDRCQGFAGQDHCSRVCRAEHGRAAGAPLTVILNGKRIVSTVGQATSTDLLSAVPETA